MTFWYWTNEHVEPSTKEPFIARLTLHETSVTSPDNDNAINLKKI